MLFVTVSVAGCDFVRMVGNPQTGFLITFPDKWKSAGDVKPVPDFVQQASRFECRFDRCGRHAIGTGLYGRLPTGMRAELGVLPSADDAAALLDLTLFLRGKLRDTHLRRATVGPTTGYRLSLTLPNKQGMMTIVHCAIVFHADRFLFISVSAPIADDALAEGLVNEVAEGLKVPPEIESETGRASADAPAPIRP